MQTRIAVDAVIASSPRTLAAVGNTKATGSPASRMMHRPITAFQKPTTVHGRIAANDTSSVQSRRPHPPGESVAPASHNSAAFLAALRAATTARLAPMSGSADPAAAELI